MPLDANTLARFKNRVFVETGTGPGFGIKAALAVGFERIISIELDEEIYKRGVEKFAENPQVEIVHGDSSRVLGRIIKEVQEPITFWLDAHGKSGDTTPNLSRKPLLSELEAIACHNYRESHTLLIDDYDLVTSPKWSPHLTEESVRERLTAINPRFLLSRVDGWLVPRKNNPYWWLVMVAEPPK